MPNGLLCETNMKKANIVVQQAGLPKPGGSECYDCGAHMSFYALHNRIWAQAIPNYKQLKQDLKTAYPHDARKHLINLCFPCLEIRLGRPLTPDDFDLPVPVNHAIAWALRTKAHPIGDWRYYIDAGIPIDPNWMHPHCQAATKALVERAPKHLARMIQSGSIEPAYLTHVAETLGQWKNWDEVVTTLLPLLDHPQAIVREGALYGLGVREGTRDERVDPKVLHLRDNDPSESIRLIAKDYIEAWEHFSPLALFEVRLRTVEQNMARHQRTLPATPLWYRKPDDQAYIMACNYSAKDCLDQLLPRLPNDDAALRVVSYWWNMGYDVLSHPGVREALEPKK